MAAAAAAAAAAQQQFYHQRQIGHGFDHGFMGRTPPPPPPPPQAGLQRMGPVGLHSILQPAAQDPNTAASYVDELEERAGTGARKVLTLFPTVEY